MIDLMILFVLLKRDLTMYSVQKRILDIFGSFAYPSFGAIKPALVRLEKKECISSSKIMSEGGKLSVFYSITNNGFRELRELMLKPFSPNPQQFISDAKIKLCCASYLKGEDLKAMKEEI